MNMMFQMKYKWLSMKSWKFQCQFRKICSQNYQKKEKRVRISVDISKNPVYITGIHPKFEIMGSKERPKKITLIGSDSKVYWFVLKMDTNGDMRKEARFVSFANMVNTMMENSPKTKAKSLKLHTYAIVPLNYKSGLVEWVFETQTLKNVICN